MMYGYVTIKLPVRGQLYLLLLQHSLDEQSLFSNQGV